VGLQQVVATLRRSGIALYAISYDDPAVLRGFAERYGITYPLLSDGDSMVIRALGLLNETADARVAGIPHPGIIVLDTAGSIVEKHFYDSYRERDTATGLLSQALGVRLPEHGPEAQGATDVVTVRAWFDTPTYSWGQRLWLTVELAVAAGYHVYGEPVPDGYVPLSVVVAPLERVQVGALQRPAPQPFRLAGVDEEFWVYEGTVQLALPLTFMLVDGGEQRVTLQVGFQVCSDRDCLPPTAVALELRLPEAPLVERPQR
jgi:hypothetical protein